MLGQSFMGTFAQFLLHKIKDFFSHIAVNGVGKIKYQ